MRHTDIRKEVQRFFFCSLKMFAVMYKNVQGRFEDKRAFLEKNNMLCIM